MLSSRHVGAGCVGQNSPPGEHTPPPFSSATQHVAPQVSSPMHVGAHCGREPNCTQMSPAVHPGTQPCWHKRSGAHTLFTPSASGTQHRCGQSASVLHRPAQAVGMLCHCTHTWLLVHKGTQGASKRAHSGSAQMPGVLGLVVGTHRSRPVQSAVVWQIVPQRQSLVRMHN